MVKKMTKNIANNILANDELVQSLLVTIEGFTHDIIPALKLEYSNDFSINFDVDNKNPEVLVITWAWKSRRLKNKKLIYRQATTKTEDNFKNEVKTYLYDLIIMLLNL